MKLVNFTDPVLTIPTNPFDFNNPPFEPIEFSKQLIEFMYKSNGIGLAANQIGIPYSIFAMRGQPENFVCFNPRIVGCSEATNDLDEGCLTYPKLVVTITRPQSIRVRFQTPNGETRTDHFTGMTARIVQHEMMHLNGKVFFDGLVSRIHLERALKKNKDLVGKGLMKYIR